jgi:hypothetical protein
MQTTYSQPKPMSNLNGSRTTAGFCGHQGFDWQRLQGNDLPSASIKNPNRPEVRN